MKNFFKWCGYLLVFTILISLILSIFVETKDQAAQLAASITDWKNTLRIVRWTAIAVLAVYWLEACQLLAKYKNLSPEQTERAGAMRWHVIISLISFELLIIESLPSKIFGG